jgi:hypothetical protein
VSTGPETQECETLIDLGISSGHDGYMVTGRAASSDEGQGVDVAAGTDLERTGTEDLTTANRRASSLENVGRSLSPGESPAGDSPGASRKRDNANDVVLGLVVLGLVLLLSLAALWTNDTIRSWFLQDGTWLLFVILAIILAGFLTSLVIWLKTADPKARAGTLVLGGSPMLLLIILALTYWLPPQHRLVAIRFVVLVVLVTFPAALWWLFLASQRASLLNEFLSNLDRLGLLKARRVGSYTETKESTDIRIHSYVQKFEATYGPVPQKVHTEVQNREFQPYSDVEIRAQTPLATAGIPVSMMVIVLAIGWLVTLPPIPNFPSAESLPSIPHLPSVESLPRWLLALIPNLTPPTVAFLGAYFYSLQMLFRRYVRNDLRGSAYIAVLIRTVLALIGVWVLSSILPEVFKISDEWMLVVAFVVGVFPLVVWQVISGLARRGFSWALPTLESTLGLSKLDGLTVWHESRLEEEDIENVPNMATADIVDLMVNTRIPAGRIVDWVDQAILLTHLGGTPKKGNVGDKKNNDGDSSRQALLNYGIRTASSLIEVSDELDHQDHDGARANFPSILGTADHLRFLAVAVRSNSNLALILNWRGMKSPDGQ